MLPEHKKNSSQSSIIIVSISFRNIQKWRGKNYSATSIQFPYHHHFYTFHLINFIISLFLKPKWKTVILLGVFLSSSIEIGEAKIDVVINSVSSWRGTNISGNISDHNSLLSRCVCHPCLIEGIKICKLLVFRPSQDSHR